MFKEFSDISRSEWLDKITAELKGKKTPDDLKTNLGGGIVINPLLNHFDQIEDHTVKNFPIQLEMSIVLPSEISNENLLGLLNLGLSCPILNQSYNFDQLFNGVILEYIQLAATDTKILKDLNHFIDNHNLNIKPYYLNLDNVIHLENILDDTPYSNNLFKDIRSVVHDSNTVILKLSHHIAINISFLRALRLYLEYIGKNSKIICVPAFNNTTLANNLIELTNQMMSAQIGGSDIFVVNYNSNWDDLKSLKLYLNIYNVMDMEAHMSMDDDPVRGSYMIENLTGQILNKIKK